MEQSNPGYSDTPLLNKLGITPTMKVLLLDAPSHYASWLRADIVPQLVRKGQVPDFLHLFAVNQVGFSKTCP
jgi:hypothetical protein